MIVWYRSYAGKRTSLPHIPRHSAISTSTLQWRSEFPLYYFLSFTGKKGGDLIFKIRLRIALADAFILRAE